jgi:hypothetical protein
VIGNEVSGTWSNSLEGSVLLEIVASFRNRGHRAWSDTSS